MEAHQIEAIRANILQGASVIESNRDDIVALCAELDARLSQAGKVDGINYQTVHGISMGARNAPEGPIYQERFHLLEVLDALDLAAAAIDAKKATPADPTEAPVDPA
jgi:hypothetical protein